MPGPVVYAVAVIGTIGTIAAIVAFKEFVYEPHFAPQFEAWAQSYVDRRRRERARRQGPIGVPVSPTDDPDENAGRRSPNRTRRGHSDSSDEDDDSPAIEMASLLSRDENLRRSSNPGRSDLRRRTRATGPIDESNGGLPYTPLSPSRPSAVSFTEPIPPSNISQPLRVQSPAQPSVIHSPSPRTTGTPEMWHSAAEPLSRAVLPPNLPTPVSNRSPASSRAMSPISAHTARSSSSMSSFTPAVIGPQSPNSAFASPRFTSVDTLSDAGRSHPDMLSVPTSRVTSPFSDIHAVQSAHHSTRSDGTSPLVLSPGSVFSDFEMPDSDFGMLSPSLRSGMFSPSVVQEEDPFEVGSTHESDDLSSWASAGRRTPEP